MPGTDECLCQVAFEIDGIIDTNPNWPNPNPLCPVHRYLVEEVVPFDLPLEEED